MSIFTGSRGQYHWLERTAGYLWDVLEISPQVVEGNFVSVTSYDSGPLRLSPEEVAQGWYKHGDLAVSPLVTKADLVPNDLYDEWYIFGTPTEFSGYEVFVNYSGFSLHTGNSEAIALQERFWQQLERISPSSYLAEGDNLIWVTLDTVLFKQVVQALRRKQNSAQLRHNNHCRGRSAPLSLTVIPH